MNKNPKVDAYIEGLEDWQQEICYAVRDLIHEADPDIEEVIKFTNRPYFVHKGNVAALLAAKNHVNVFIYDPIAPDPEGIINQGHGNSTARSVQISKGQTINKPALLELIKHVVANNEAGGWRKLS